MAFVVFAILAVLWSPFTPNPVAYLPRPSIPTPLRCGGHGTRRAHAPRERDEVQSTLAPRLRAAQVQVRTPAAPLTPCPQSGGALGEMLPVMNVTEFGIIVRWLLKARAGRR